jgi:8-amino-7-oxononanoate synthase
MMRCESCTAAQELAMSAAIETGQPINMTDSAAHDVYRIALERLDQQNRLRRLEPRSGLDFSSNDYLGLATSKRLAEVLAAALKRGTPVGAGGSRLLRGNCDEHEQLEAAAATFFHAERTLFFGSGYLANFAIFSTLPQREDLVIFDDLIHASAREGLRAARAASATIRHNDVDAARSAIDRWRSTGNLGRVWIAVESLYSMDGDRAPLGELMALADKHDAFLVIDEAHATGVFGPDGRGLAACFEGRANVIVLHTCGKALGGAGALVSAAHTLCDFLVNRCRPFIYSTAPSPLMAVAALEALAILKEEPGRRDRLSRLVTHAGEEARKRGLSESGSQILPIILGEDRTTMSVAAALRAQGFDVRGVRPPTVPQGTARLRISLTLNVDERAISRLFEALAQELRNVQA